mmetsp:Transcript_32736/g.60142  ORF Transcript_32736/g.60142 Transcript_32736/m.60142 type:complete len:221 (-) Transcript_32736:479-1141(-)
MSVISVCSMPVVTRRFSLRSTNLARFRQLSCSVTLGALPSETSAKSVFMLWVASTVTAVLHDSWLDSIASSMPSGPWFSYSARGLCLVSDGTLPRDSSLPASEVDVSLTFFTSRITDSSELSISCCCVMKLPNSLSTSASQNTRLSSPTTLCTANLSSFIPSLVMFNNVTSCMALLSVGSCRHAFFSDRNSCSGRPRISCTMPEMKSVPSSFRPSSIPQS